MDSTYPNIKASDFSDYDWEHCYCHYIEEIANNISEVFGLEMVIRKFVDANCARDPLSRRSRPDFIMIVSLVSI